MMSAVTSALGFDIEPLDDARREELARRLNPEERRVILNHGTERAFCGTLLKNKEKGSYACKLCGLPLFRSDEKFESGTGWPSFTRPLDERHVREIEDRSHGMVRAEIRCGRCDGHLGHVFPDGPPPTFRRYCLNSVSLEFFADGEVIEQRTASSITNAAEAPRSHSPSDRVAAWSQVDESSDESFPASDPPAW
jgi:peptide-methionine (R)-S-oxide reductase